MSRHQITETPVDARPEYKITDWADTGPSRKKLKYNERLWRMLWTFLLPAKSHPIGITPAGFVHIMVSVGLMSAAYASSSNNILFMALSLVLSTLILSGILSWMNFRGGRWRLLLPAHFRVDEPAPISVELWNTKRLLPTCCIWVKVRTKKLGEWERLFLEERLDPDQQSKLEWLFTPRERGVDQVEVSGLESQFPFGFLRKTMGVGVEREIVVTPRRVEYDFRTPVARRGRQLGASTRRPGSGAELMNIRRYQRGDPQRIVHWKATARTRQLMVRQMEEENRDGYIVFVETPASIWQDKDQFEKLCSFAASLAEDLFREGRLVGVALNDEPLLVVKRLHDLQLYLELLARVEPTSGYRPAGEHYGGNLITFKPGSKQEVHAYLSGNLAGSA
ncbi:DUF58 domain-containing protein [Cerasicoccus maritimus]|uniref:DUF58 domain-containing protein n=1 Tax=Cerasicoccus maritimus TaxID=490089 RepID=UPI002852CC07|nr:DUF58 domain-containing protein [Cerasicoccus maritimus]